MTFREKLRQLREAAGLSEAKLAELSGVTFGALHNYGLGIRKPTFAAVVRLAKALGVSCEAFAECSDIAAGDSEIGAKTRRRGAGRKQS
jgi:transcriptional regulator with XRE-family HTH domain